MSGADPGRAFFLDSICNLMVSNFTDNRDVFKALADPTRRAILSMLRLGRQPVGSIARKFTMSRPAVSKHLRLLRQAELVVEMREGRNRLYELNAKPLMEVDEWLSSYRPMWQSRLRNLKQFLETQDEGVTDHE
ncbi:MAG: metalloregulator ArsR/SmtB family transcription factor [Methylococcaceae bacterium]|nr:metalloregulator ArsR/SmtB family transcription factor [Methylococcaceae bacterium]